jgi:hypothetical protein
MSKKYGPKERGLMESDEKSNQVKTDLPGSRFSEVVQTQTFPGNVTPSADVAGSGEKKDIIADQLKEIKHKVKIKPDAAVKLSDKDIVGGADSGLAVSFSAAGAYDATVVGDASKIPYTEGGFRPNSRSAKKTADTDFLINNAVSEQIIPEFEGSKDLRKNPNSLQGYNGRKQFNSARGKKNAGSLPQETLFDRSIDFHFIDSTVHTTGQVLDNISAEADYPTETALNNKVTGVGGWKEIDNPMKKGNYILKDFHFTIKDGKINSVGFNEDYIPAHVNQEQAMQSNLNWQVDRNNVTKTVIRLQKELGRETSEKWSPLGYVIKQPYQYNMLAHDIEATTGAIQLLAYRAANTSLAFQFNNKLAKDGAKPVEPVTEMFLSGIGQVPYSLHKDMFGKASIEDITFNKKLLAQGSAAAIIKMFDSTGKYSTKANFINSQKSLKYFIQTMDNNINPLHCKKDFLMALDTAHVFSTIDGEYNPMLPIIATDKISIVNPLSLGKFLEGWSRSNVSPDNPSGTANIYAFKYSDIRNAYYTPIKHPIVEGLLTWMMENEGALVKAYGVDATVTMPAFFSMLAPSMFQSMLCAASYKILFARSIYFKEFLFAGDQSEYIWKDLDSLEHLNPKYSSNMTITDFRSPLKVGALKPASFVHIYWGDTFNQFDGNTSAVDETLIGMPWYYNENSFKRTYDEDNGFYDDRGHPYTMSYPEVRQGVLHEYIDKLQSMDERDVRLSLDRSVGIPLRMTKDNDESTANLSVYKIDDKVAKDIPEDEDSEIMDIVAIRYDANSDGRIAVKYIGADYQPTKASIMGLPREVGYLYPHLRVQPILDDIHGEGAEKDFEMKFNRVGFYKMGGNMTDSLGHALVSYQALGRDTDETAISRTAALKQDYCMLFADRSNEAIVLNSHFIDYVGIVPALSCLFTPNTNANEITFRDTSITAPYKVLGTNETLDESVTKKYISLSRYTWTMMNRFFMPINVFENCLIQNGKTEDAEEGVINMGVLVDPMESSFMFGLSGFLASDFEQDVLDRAEKYDQLNVDYIEDEFIKSSLIFRAN